jgi:hypothetical protein
VPPDPIEEITEHLTGVLAAPVSVEQTRAWLTDANAHRRSPLREVTEYLRTHPDALRSGSPDCPIGLVRLVHVLHEAGHNEVTRPACTVCGRVRVDLCWIGTAGRICRRCHDRTRHDRACAGCGATTTVTAHYTGRRLCADCRREHQQRQRPACARCGTKPKPSCRRCYPRLHQTCITCGVSCEPRKITELGPVCVACYQPGHRTCGTCGRLRPVIKRADDNGPDLCENCYRGPSAVCSVCGRQRPCHRIGTGAPICRGCRTPPQRLCARCGRHRTIKNDHWPIGPVCDTCYHYIRDHPAACTQCGQKAPAIARTATGEQRCATCAGVNITYTCRGCGRHGQIYTNHRCYTCCLTDQVHTLLTGPDGQVSQQLQPLATALCHTDHPTTTLRWIQGNQPAARLLNQLAAAGTPITHDLLDERPPSNAVHYLRDMLTAAGVLPTRDEPLERLTPWLRQLLAAVPASHAQIIKPFAYWSVFRRSRRRAAHRKQSHGTAEYARVSIRRALTLLSWLDQHDTTLQDLTQPQFDQWLADRPHAGHDIRPFISWARARHLTGHDIRIPGTPQAQPAVFLDDQDRLDQLDHCLHDEKMPLDLRVAGCITLLFGIMINRIASLTKEDVVITGPDTFLTTISHQLQLPPGLATLIRQLRDQTTVRGTLARIGPSSRWLFPGNHTNRPANAHYLSQRLRRHGIQPHAGRNTARIALAAELPASVLADLTGISITTATHWSSWAQRNWTDYIATRDPNTAPQE